MAVVVAWALLALPASAQDSRAGGRLAVRWCLACHIVGPNQSTATDSAPSFREIAAQPSTTADSPDRYLSVGLALMPDFLLNSQERNALVAHILSPR